MVYLVMRSSFAGSFFFFCLLLLCMLSHFNIMFGCGQIMMQAVAQSNPFSTQHFIWIDSGYFRSPNIAPHLSPIVRNNITENGVLPSKVFFRNFLDNPKFQDLSGGAWGGTRQALDAYADKYWKVFWYMSQNGHFIGAEQNVMTTTCLNFPSLCSVHEGTYGGWFTVGSDWLRQYHFSFSNEILLKDNGIAKISTHVNPFIPALVPLPELDPVSKTYA